MTYLDYIIFFQKLDRASNFSAGATRLYLKLLDVANGIADGGAWPKEFAKSDPYMRGLCGASLNPFKNYRDELKERGLIAVTEGGNGAGNTTAYRLLPSKKVSESDTLPADKVSDYDTQSAHKVSESDTIVPENADKVSGKVSDSDTPYIEGEKEKSKDAATAAVSASFSGKPSAPKSSKKKGLDHAAVAALPLPHPSPAFAELWLTFYTENTHQQVKPVSALEKLLARLGRWPEDAAIRVLEAAIESNWSGFAHEGATKIVDSWKAQQATRPTVGAAPAPAPELNLEFIAEQQAQEEQARAARFDKYATA